LSRLREWLRWGRTIETSRGESLSERKNSLSMKRFDAVRFFHEDQGVLPEGILGRY
jgi:hypothetical protein